LVSAYCKAQNNAIIWQDARDIFVAEVKESRILIDIEESNVHLNNMAIQQKAKPTFCLAGLPDLKREAIFI